MESHKLIHQELTRVIEIMSKHQGEHMARRALVTGHTRAAHVLRKASPSCNRTTPLQIRAINLYFSLRVVELGRVSETSRSCLDDSEVALRPTTERAKCFLVARALVGSDGLLDTVELDHDGAL